MNRDDIIRMALEAGFMVVAEGEPEVGDWYECFIEEIERFAARVAADEREACAKMIEIEPPLVDFAKNMYGGCAVCGLTPKLIAAFIRARGQE